MISKKPVRSLSITNSFFLRPGDCIVVSDLGTGILVRSTRNYWYYHYNGHTCRVSKRRLWSLLDRNKVELVYGTTLKRRKKKRLQRTLDLHGVSLREAEEKIRNFLNFIHLPCKIITGKSNKMKQKVNQVVCEFGWRSREESAQNPGSLIIDEK